MTLIRWGNFREMDNLQREINRLFDNLSSTKTQPENGKAYIPRAEIRETEEEIHLKLEVPGIDAKEIDVQVTVDSVTIEGERKSLSRTDAKGKKSSEFHYGAFRRLINLPTRVQNTNVNAEYKNGILHLTLPKAEEEKHKVVKVNVS